MEDNGVCIFPNVCTGGATNSLDPNLLLALQNNGGFGGNGNWIWIIFLWMMWMNGGFNNFRNQGGSFNELAAQLNGDTGREFVTQILGGKIDCVSQLAQMLGTNIESVKSSICGLSTAIQNVTGQVGLTALQTQNSILLGNANLAQQIAQCCCDNRLAICEQTNTLQRQADQNFAAKQLQDANYFAEQRLANSQQTNQILTSNQVNTQAVIDKINDQNVMITKQFCDLKEREYQSEIKAMGDTILQLRGQISNDRQDAKFVTAINALTERLIRIESHQPNTVSVPYPNVAAVNVTPNIVPQNQGCGCGNFNGWGQGGVVL